MFFVYLAALQLLLGAEIASEWPRVRQELQREDTPPEGPPLAQEIKDALRGLWVHRREQTRSGTDRDRAP